MSNIAKGAKGQNVVLIQERLTELGYVCGDVDGVFGSQTHDAVEAFQADNGLKVDGIVGVNTLAALGISLIATSGDSVLDFIRWALTHADPGSIPNDAAMLIPKADCGTDPWEYLYGTSGRVCTQSLLDAKYDDYYKKNGWSRSLYDKATAGWVENAIMVADCQGLLDAYCTQVLGVKTDLNAHGCYTRWCTSAGRIRDISRAYVIGEAVFRSNDYGTMKHVGWVCGFASDGEPLVIEERGLSYGCVVTRLSGRGWTHRGLMTVRFLYEEAAPEPVGASFFAVCGGGSVHVRCGPGKQYASLGIAREGDRMLALHVPDGDGWKQVAVVLDGEMLLGYMSGKYVEEV